MARATIPDAKTSLLEVYETLRSLGFRKMAFTEVCSNSGKQRGYPEEDIPRWKQDYFDLAVKLAREAPTIDDLPLGHLHDHTAALVNTDLSYYCCMTGISLFYVNPEGELFPCSRLLTDEKHFRLGTVFTDVDEDVAQKFKENHVFNRPCRTCWARYLCGGQCFGDAFFESSDLARPSSGYCEKLKWKIEVAAYVADEFRRNGKLPAHKEKTLPSRIASRIACLLPGRRTASTAQGTGAGQPATTCPGSSTNKGGGT
jgi:uncharacterized protein